MYIYIYIYMFIYVYIHKLAALRLLQLAPDWVSNIVFGASRDKLAHVELVLAYSGFPKASGS